MTPITEIIIPTVQCYFHPELTRNIYPIESLYCPELNKKRGKLWAFLDRAFCAVGMGSDFGEMFL